MELETALQTYLLTRSALLTLVGQDKDGDYKLYGDEAPSYATLPYVTRQQISAGISKDLQGKTEYEYPSYQWTVYAETKLAAKAIGRELKTALTDYRGTLSGLYIQWIELINDLSGKAQIYESTTVDTLYLEYKIHYDYQ